MELKSSEAHGEVRSEGSLEERYGPMDRNWIGGCERRTSWQLTAKSVSIKALVANPAVVYREQSLIAGDLRHVSDS
jgi:hypothetical protein